MLDEQFRKLLENNITCYAYEYDFYYNLENVIAKPRNFTKIAGRITRIVANKELTLSDHSSDIIDVAPFSTYHESQKSN